jgi:hypothetical protein
VRSGTSTDGNGAAEPGATGAGGSSGTGGAKGATGRSPGDDICSGIRPIGGWRRAPRRSSRRSTVQSGGGVCFVSSRAKIDPASTGGCSGRTTTPKISERWSAADSSVAMSSRSQASRATAGSRRVQPRKSGSPRRTRSKHNRILPQRFLPSGAHLRLHAAVIHPASSASLLCGSSSVSTFSARRKAAPSRGPVARQALSFPCRTEGSRSARPTRRPERDRHSGTPRWAWR